MAMAYILIKTSPGHARDVYYRSNYLDEICEAHPLVGEYDLIFKVKADNSETIGYIIEDKIKKLDDIISTETLPVTDFINNGKKLRKTIIKRI